MTKTWFEFYRTRTTTGYYNHFKKKYGPFIDTVASYVRPSDDLLEIGCGTANTTRALLERLTEADYWWIATDKDVDMLALAALNLPDNHPVCLIQRDALAVPEYSPDVIHSHGMLEHMTDAEIRQVIRAAAQTPARASIHYVPSAKYKWPSFGDERLMTPAEWYIIAAPDRILEFNRGYDLVLVWEHRR